MVKKSQRERVAFGRSIFADRLRAHVDRLPVSKDDSMHVCDLLASAFGDALDGDDDAMLFIGGFMRAAYEHDVEFAVRQALKNLRLAEAAHKQGGTA